MKIKLAICTPSTGNPRIEWTESVIGVVKATLVNPKYKISDIKLFFFCSSVIPENRNRVVNHALAWGATHLLFIDEDQRFPVEVFKALWKNEKLPIIGANCCRRMYPIQFMAIGLDHKPVDSRGKQGLEEVLFTGFSFIMIRAEVFRKVAKPWTMFPYLSESDNYGTEDYYFFLKARDAGFPCIIDHDISQLIQHIGAHAFDPLSERGVYINKERDEPVEANDSPD